MIICSLALIFSSKAVSDGAISFYVDHFVRSRVSKFAYGSFRAVKFDPTDPEHQECRIKDLYTSNSGELMVKDTFGIILPKVCTCTRSSYKSS